MKDLIDAADMMSDKGYKLSTLEKQQEFASKRNRSLMKMEKAKRAKATVIQAPLLGALDQEVNVGDTVMVVTTGYSRVGIRKGVYKGYIEGSGYYPKRARIEVQTTRTIQYKPDGTPFNWSKDYDSNTWNDVRPTLVFKTEPYVHETTLNLNRIVSIKE
jgi:hypothetical protein